MCTFWKGTATEYLFFWEWTCLYIRLFLTQYKSVFMQDEIWLPLQYMLGRGSSYLGVCGPLQSSCVTGFPKTPLVNRHFLTHWFVSLRISHYKWTMRHVALLTLCNPKKACSWWCGRDWRGVSQGLIFEVCLVKQAAGEGNPTAALRPGLVNPPPPLLTGALGLTCGPLTMAHC